MTDDELRGALSPFVTREWPIEKLLTLCREWRAGTSSRQIGERVGKSPHAVVSKADRLMGNGPLGAVLFPRASPIIRDGGPRVSRPNPLPPGARTLPLLPSERAAP